jgi:hypothetical protein
MAAAVGRGAVLAALDRSVLIVKHDSFAVRILLAILKKKSAIFK